MELNLGYKIPVYWKGTDVLYMYWLNIASVSFGYSNCVPTLGDMVIKE